MTALVGRCLKGIGLPVYHSVSTATASRSVATAEPIIMIRETGLLFTLAKKQLSYSGVLTFAGNEEEVVQGVPKRTLER